jgi:hypothetical protein
VQGSILARPIFLRKRSWSSGGGLQGNRQKPKQKGIIVE